MTHGEKSIADMTPEEARAEIAALQTASNKMERAAWVKRLWDARLLIEGVRDLGIPDGEYFLVRRILKEWTDMLEAKSDED